MTTSTQKLRAELDQIIERQSRKKKCRRCEGEFPSDQMLWRHGKPSTVCLECHAERQRVYASRHRAAGKKRQYRSRPTIYDRLIQHQGEERCAICGVEPEKERGLVIDHCHATGQLRGLLCGHCNLALGFLKDDPERIRKAIAYLEGQG